MYRTAKTSPPKHHPPPSERMSQQLSFKAIQLTRYGDNAGSQTHRQATAHDKPPWWVLGRLYYKTLFERSCQRVEWYTIPQYPQLPQFVTVVPPNGNTANREPYLRQFGQDAARMLPEKITVDLTTVNLAPLGTTPAPTHRLLTTTVNLSSWHDGAVESGPTPLQRFIKRLTDYSEPYLLKVAVRKTKRGTLEVSVWWVDYAPTARCRTDEEFVRYQTTATRPSLAATFGGEPLTTNVDLPERHGCEYASSATGGWVDTPTCELPIGERAVAEAELALELARTPQEYYNSLTVGSDDETMRNAYQQLGVDPWLPIGSEQLPGFCGLLSVFYPESVWRTAPGRTEPRTETHDSFREQHTNRDTTHTQPTIATDATHPAESPAISESRQLCSNSSHSEVMQTTGHPADELVQTTAIGMLERGDQLQPVTVGPPELKFKAKTPDETTTYVLVGDETLTAGSVVAATGVTQRTPAVDTLTIVVESDETASQVTEWLREPFVAPTKGGGVRLYRGSQPLVDDTQQAIRPSNTDPEAWYVSPDGTVYCVHEDNVCASVSLSRLQSKPLTALLAELPEAYKTTIESTTEPSTDGPSADITTQPQEKVPMSTPVWLPHVAGGLNDTTVLVNEASHFTEHCPTARWEQELLSVETGRAATEFLNQYTSDADGDTLTLETVVSLFCSWYYAHTGREPITPTAALKRGYKSIYGQPIREMTTQLPNCQWVYPPESVCSEAR